MLYYWQTKYTTSIYITFFNFPHNRHFFVHISPSVLEVWKSPAVELRSSHPKTLTHCFLNCLRCLITLSTQLILHKSEKMIVGECHIRSIGGVWKNFSPHLCHCFRCEASGVGASVVMQDDDVSSQKFIAQCTTELVQCLGITSSSDGLPTFHEFGQNQPLCIPEDCPSPSQLMAHLGCSFSNL